MHSVLRGTLVCALLLLMPIMAGAQWHNELGIYTDSMNNNLAADPMSVHTVYVTITNPYNPYESADIYKIHGYECQVVLDGPGEILELEWPVWALNIGDFHNQIVAYGHEDIQVFDGAAVLAIMQIQYQGDGVQPLTLTLKPTIPASIDNSLAYLDGHNDHVTELMPLTSVAGSFDAPVFGFNADPQIVAVEEVTMDGIKALFR